MLKWTDTLEIAIQLNDLYPQQHPLTINFVDLRDLVMKLPDFADDANRCGERILEAIQQAWIDEKDE